MKAPCVVAASLVLSLVAAQAQPADAPARRWFTSDDFYRVQALSDPQVSPDGRWVAYVVTTSDRDADEQRSAIWMASWDGTEQLALTAAASDTEKPRWSPDGRYLSFLTSPVGSDKLQLMLLDRRGGEPRQLTTVTGDIHEYAWSPDGKRVALAMDQPAESSKPPKPSVIDALHFKHDEEGYRANGRQRHVYLVDVETKRLEPLTGDSQFRETETLDPAGMWCMIWIITHIGIHSREDDPDDHRRATPEARRQADSGSKDYPIGVHSRRTRGRAPAGANSRA